MITARIARWATFLASASILVTIKAEIVLGVALLAIVAGRLPLRFPPLLLPIGALWAWTFVSLAASPDPWAGRSQIVKIFLFGVLLAVATAFRSTADGRKLVIAWTAIALGSSALSFAQFATKLDYGSYVVSRTTGFMSHWMTFGGELMIVLTWLAAMLLFGRAARWWWIAAAVLAAAMALNGTRNTWAGAAVALTYLLCRRKPVLVLAIPALAVAAYFAGPQLVRQRVDSIFRPHGELDSNQHRVVTFRTALRMIEANPIVGVGPEQVSRRFAGYIPADIPRPLPDGFYGHLHNIYLQFAAERGLPALACLLWLFARILLDLWPHRAAHWLVDGAIAAVLAVMVAGLAEHNLGDSEILVLFLVSVALGYWGKGTFPAEPVSNATEVDHIRR